MACILQKTGVDDLVAGTESGRQAGEQAPGFKYSLRQEQEYLDL